MGLPYLIESLLSIRRPNGGNLVHQGASQTVVNQMPPYTQIVLNVFPFGTDYFDIVYQSYIDPTVVPDVYHGYGQYFGTRMYEGTIAAGFMAYQLESLVFISGAEPAQALIRNNTPVYQYYAGVAFYVAIASEKDYDAILEHLEASGSSGTKQLLDLLSSKKPVGGGV